MGVRSGFSDVTPPPNPTQPHPPLLLEHLPPPLKWPPRTSRFALVAVHLRRLAGDGLHLSVAGRRLLCLHRLTAVLLDRLAAVQPEEERDTRGASVNNRLPSKVPSCRLPLVRVGFQRIILKEKIERKREE